MQITAEFSAVAVHGVTGRLFWAVYTGTRPGVTPAIRAGKGWRGRRELAPRCSATQLGARVRVAGQTPSCNTKVHHHHHHHHHHTITHPHAQHAQHA